ncbi:MAG TPA: pilus assembly PilX N-terminal domain-containing protein [Gammaproteobacteria bacterium]|jgi:MSHA biogenesis protein MshP
MTRRIPPRHPGERGFALVAAIFIVVILALLGIMIVTIGGMERATATTSMRGTQAYFAARTGMEWGIFGALNNTVATCGGAPSTPTTNTFNLAVPGLDNYSVSVLCRYTEHREGGPPNIKVFVITSTATSRTFGDIDFVSRIIRVTVTDATP